nr:zinc finger, BED-type, phospholipase-like, homeodomain-like protein [Tanacetum cinerariifolium]
METQSDSITTGVGSSSAPAIVQILATPRNPQIWIDYNLCKISDNMIKAQCNHCFHFFSQNSNSTLKNNISHPHCEALKTVPEVGQSFMSRDGSVFVYNSDVLHEQFTGLVIQQGLPFNPNTQMTRVSQNYMQPKYNHEKEVQLQEAIALSDEEVALDEAASEARSNGGEEIYDMTLSESD